MNKIRRRAGLIGKALKQLSSRPRLGYALRTLAALDGKHERTCTLCGYRGFLRAYGQPPRYDAQCPGCGSLERHRHLALALSRRGLFEAHARVLHFAPEPGIVELYERKVEEYVRADLSGNRGTVRQDITDISLPDASFDVVIANHVLEHVPDDASAMREVFRVLRPGGTFVTSVPLADGWSRTYENDDVDDAFEREIHFGATEHVRLYSGEDFERRLRGVGFEVDVDRLSGPETVEYAVLPGSKIFFCVRTA